MTDFEFIFVLYSLVLGLSIVELLAGFGKALELRLAHSPGSRRFSIGYLVPLFGIFVMLDLLSFWSFAWVVRDLIEVSTISLLCVLSFAGIYYLAARLVFPTEPNDFVNLDTHYYRVRRVILGLLIALVVIQWAWLLSLEPIRDQLLTFTSVSLTVLFVALMVAAMLTRSRRWSIVWLSALSIRYLALYALG